MEDYKELYKAQKIVTKQLEEKNDELNKMIKLIAEEIKERWNVELNLEYFRKKVKDEY